MASKKRKKSGGLFGFLRRKATKGRKARAKSGGGGFVTRGEFNELKGRVTTVESKVARIDRHLFGAAKHLRAA